MALLSKERFVCFDCESTGLDPEKDRILEIGAVRFSLEEGVIDSWESLVDPECEIPESSIEIHHITPEMVAGQPKAADLIPKLVEFVGQSILVGHGIRFDVELVMAEAKRAAIGCTLGGRQQIDTLRLARHYGESPSNSLEVLRNHFNIEGDQAHRALSDARVNAAVFSHLARRYKTTEEVLKIISKPVLLKTMPLGKHKGRLMREIPEEYLRWAARQKFDDDLLFSLRTELKARRKGNRPSRGHNPFEAL